MELEKPLDHCDLIVIRLAYGFSLRRGFAQGERFRLGCRLFRLLRLTGLRSDLLQFV